ncbi:hypothetical protein K8R03_04405 [Candidatus Kaiserbacteria bacterium]|nr:hypothetical protein [Candidatus Kaiserbacteria bacterium]
MRTSRTYALLSVALAVYAMPLLASAQASNYQYARDGVLGCSAGQYGGSPGTTAAIGSIYVPVFDAAVTLNTGVLIYKECILRGIVDRMRENMTASTIKGGVISFNSGRTTTDANGNIIQQPLFPTNLKQDKVVETDRVIAKDLNPDGSIKSGGLYSNINPAFRDVVARAAVRGYYLSTRQPNSDLTCSYSDVTAAINGSPQSVWDALDAFKNPACSPILAYQLANQHLKDSVSTALSDMIIKLSWGNGIYDIAAPDANGDLITKTPARFIGSGMEQLLESGFNQQQSANDVDQMVGSLFAGMTTAVISDNQGLAGLTQSTGGLPSYLDRVISEAQAGLRQAVSNAALAILTASQKIEKAYGDTMRAIDKLLTDTQNNFKQAERVCWENIVQRTCATVLKADNTCTAPAGACTTDPTTGVQTCPKGDEIKVSTSTIYSQAAIASSPVFSVAATVKQNITISDNAMVLFAQLIASVSGTSSAGAQSLALQQLDQLVGQKLLHTQQDLDTAGATQKSIQQSISTLVEQITHSWNGDASDGTAGVIPFNGVYPPQSAADIVGWCNYNNNSAGTASIQKWIAKWKK